MNPTPLELLLSGRYRELVARMRSGTARDLLLAEVAVRYGGPLATQDAPATRQWNIVASGDWSWGLLTSVQRRQFLARDTRLLSGSGRPDGGQAQAAALRRLRAELGRLYDTLQVALAEDDLAWLLPLAEHLSGVLEITGEFSSMQGRYRALLDAAQRLGSARLELHARLGLSLALQNLGRYAEASEQAAAASDLALGLGERSLQAAALHLDGSARAVAGDHAAARWLLTSALERRRELGEKHGAVATASNLAYVERNQGRLAPAQALLEDALAGCRALGDRRGEAKFLQNLGALAYETGNQARTLELAAEALAIYRELGDRPGEVGSLSMLGFAEYGGGRLGAARALLEQVLALSRDPADHSAHVTALLMLGNIALLEGSALAASHYGEALELCRAAGNRQYEARSLCGLANSAAFGGDLNQAREALIPALEFFLAGGELPGVVDCLAYGAALLAGLASCADAAPAAELLHAQAVSALAGARVQAAQLGHHFDPLDEHIMEETQRLLGTTGSVPAGDAALSLEALAQGLLGALRLAR